MTIRNKKIETIDNKAERKKTQYGLDKLLISIRTLLSENVGKQRFLTGEHILPMKGLLEKVAKIKTFEYLPLGSEFKKETEIARK